MSDAIATERKRWLLPETVDSDVVEGLCRDTGQPRVVCELLARRGVRNIEEARRFLAPRLDFLPEPTLLKGTDALADRLAQARAAGKRVGIHGDYDVDGLVSATLLTRALRELGFDVVSFVPHRMVDGYGVSERALEDFSTQGVDVLLTCDAGISAERELAIAKEQYGMEVIVTDHHLPPTDGVPSSADVVVNPHQEGCPYPFKDICGAAVAYRSLQVLAQRLGWDEAELLHKHLDLVALGTVCDVMPLVEDNRILAHQGVRQARQSIHPGLHALADVANVELKDVSARTFGWTFGPRLNAAGRIDDADLGLRLLLADDYDEALEIARRLDAINRERQALSNAIEADARDEIEGSDWSEARSLVLFGEDGQADWHHGVLGIVASRVVKSTGRPAFLFAQDEASGLWKGSGRAPEVDGLHLLNALNECAEHLADHGGHERAAGATLKATDPEGHRAFREAFERAIARQVSLEALQPTARADIEVDLSELDGDVHAMLKRFQPFGEGNPPIRFVARDVRITQSRVIGKGKNHLKLSVDQNGTQFDALLWDGAADFQDLVEDQVPWAGDLLFDVKEEEYRGRRQMNLVLTDMRLDGPIQERERSAAEILDGIRVGNTSGRVRGGPLP